VALRKRTEAIARHLTNHLRLTGRFDKTLVFCVDQDHALEMRQALVNLNADLAAIYPDYVCRVTADEGERGLGHTPLCRPPVRRPAGRPVAGRDGCRRRHHPRRIP
jgi:hypothetical protein